MPRSSNVSSLYPDLVLISCKNCKLECNVCQNCDVDEFLKCEIVPEECALRYNILRRLMKNAKITKR
jgi:pyruvate-formate lyase-activating enzyme